jgi:hypothetical protein
MANYVNTNVEFIQINAAAKSKLIEMFQRIQERNDHKWFSDIFVEGDLTYDEVLKYSWTLENIGPKWCYLEDYDMDTEMPYFSTTSAWSAPLEGLEKLLRELAVLDPQMKTTVTYDDEMPNFVGWCVYQGDEMVDSCEYDDEEIREGIFSEHAHLREGWDEEEESWKDDDVGLAAEDEYRDLMYEWIGDTQHEGIQQTLKYNDD